MTLFWNILQSIITIFEIRVCVWMMESFAEPRFRGKKQKIVVWIVSLGVGGLYAANRWTTVYYSRAMMLIILAILCIASMWMFMYHWKIAIFVAANYLLVGGLIDLVMMSTVETVTQKSGLFFHIDYVNDGYRLCVMTFSKAILLLVCFGMRRKIDKTVIYHLAGKGIKVICISLCVIEYIGLHTLNMILNTNVSITQDFMLRSFFYLIVILLLMAMVWIVVLYYDKKDQLQMKSIYQKSLDYENQRMIRLYQEREELYHDFKNQLLTLDGWIHSGNLDAYSAYMERIRKPFLEKPIERKIGHDIMDLILNYKIWEAEKKEIRVSCEIRGYMDFVLEMTDEEVCSLIGNLWDNAIEACETLTNEEKWIDFKMRIRPSKFLLEIRNPYQKIRKDTHGNFVTTKTDKKPHGIGVRIIKNIVEQHNGYFNCVLDDHIFKVEIMICNE